MISRPLVSFERTYENASMHKHTNTTTTMCNHHHIMYYTGLQVFAYLCRLKMQSSRVGVKLAQPGIWELAPKKVWS